MRAYYMAGGGFVAAVLVGLYLFVPRSPGPDIGAASRAWPPTPAAIARAVGPAGAGSYLDARHRQFADMFKQRYRDQQIAVGVRFMSDTRVKLMCAALIPRWDMAHIAMELRREAKDVFGMPFDVDIYETYISTRQRKLAELRPRPGSDRVTVRFDPLFASEDQSRSGPAPYGMRGSVPPAHRGVRPGGPAPGTPPAGHGPVPHGG
jgi:hypothetical protein